MGKLIGEDIVEVDVCAEQGKQLTECETRWEDIVEMVHNMGFSLVPTEKVKPHEEKSPSDRKKGEQKVLRNLRFDVNFKELDFRRGTFNSK